jgi:hypothetical protein
MTCSTPEQFHTSLAKLSRAYYLRFKRTNQKPLSQQRESERATAHIWAKAVLRAGDWVICCRQREEDISFQLAYGLEGDQVLLADGTTLSLQQWQQGVICYWLITLSFAKAEQPVPQSPCQVRWIQRRLNLVEGLSLAEDGVYGPDTAQAVERFAHHWSQRTPGSILPLEEELAQQLAI